MKVTTASAVLVTFYTLLLLVYLRPVDRRAVAEPQQSLARAPAPQTPAPHVEPPSSPFRTRRLSSNSNLSSIEQGWAASRVASKQPIHLVVFGLSGANTDWLVAVLRIILEEALAAHGRPPVQVVTDVCRGNNAYCILNAAKFNPDALGDSDAVFTAHRDLRDVLLFHHALTPAAPRGAPVSAAYTKLVREYDVYRAWRTQACRDVRFEDLVSRLRLARSFST